MEEEDIFNLLNDEKKNISSWDSIITYLSKRMSDNDLNGLYNLTILAIKRAEKDKALTTSDLIYMYFFAIEILEKENVAWRNKKNLFKIQDVLINPLVDTIDESDPNLCEELASIFYNLAKHFEYINLALNAKANYLNAKNYYQKAGLIAEASYCYGESIYMIHRLKRENQVFPKPSEIKKEFPKNYDYPLKALTGKGKMKYDPIEQDESFLKIIDSVEEKIVMTIGLLNSDCNLDKYNKLKKQLLKFEGIDWCSKEEINASNKHR